MSLPIGGLIVGFYTLVGTTESLRRIRNKTLVFSSMQSKEAALVLLEICYHVRNWAELNGGPRKNLFWWQ